MNNLKIYEQVRNVPAEAMKEIEAGRLRGMTNIVPMWRIKVLTELFGICGIGWKYEILKKHLEQGANGEIAAFVDINLYVKADDKWSEPIQGTGGSMFVAKERNGLHTSDEAFKMALTDAISVACKSLGFGANVYWDKDPTKYDSRITREPAPEQAPNQSKVCCDLCGCEITEYVKDDKKYSPIEVKEKLGGLCTGCYRTVNNGN